jgi:hypothetical protein
MGRNNADFRKQAAGDRLLTPEELHAHVNGLLADDHPVFGVGGSFDYTQKNKYGYPKLVLGDHLTKPLERELWSNQGKPGLRVPVEQGNALKNYKHAEVANGDCELISKAVLPHMPSGSRVIRMSSRDDQDATHWAIETPTTEGPHMTDFTHKQYVDKWSGISDKSVPFPLVESKKEFMGRDSLVEPKGANGKLKEELPFGPRLAGLDSPDRDRLMK